MQDFGFFGGWLSLEGKKIEVCRLLAVSRLESVSILLFFLRYGGLEFAATMLSLLRAGVPGMSHYAK